MTKILIEEFSAGTEDDVLILTTEETFQKKLVYITITGLYPSPSGLVHM